MITHSPRARGGLPQRPRRGPPSQRSTRASSAPAHASWRSGARSRPRRGRPPTLGSESARRTGGRPAPPCHPRRARPSASARACCRAQGARERRFFFPVSRSTPTANRRGPASIQIAAHRELSDATLRLDLHPRRSPACPEKVAKNRSALGMAARVNAEAAERHGEPAERRLLRRVLHAQLLHSYGLYSDGLYSYGLYSDGLYSYGLYSYGLYSDGLYSHGRCSYGLYGHGIGPIVSSLLFCTHISTHAHAHTNPSTPVYTHCRYECLYACLCACLCACLYTGL